jgi:hypothetical protein
MKKPHNFHAIENGFLSKFLILGQEKEAEE